MKHRRFVVVGLLMVAGILGAGSATGVLNANKPEFSNEDLSGMYIIQLAGAYVFPSTSPLAVINGPFAVNGTIWADGQGTMKKQLIVNYNGQIYRINNAESTYQVNPDGTYTETFVTQFGQSPATITYEGVLVKNGKEARLIVSGFSLPGISLPPGYVGSVVSGSMIRQGEGRDGD